jgi:hypothetical protein
MSIDEQICLLSDLQSLLERQIELARQGNISDVEVLSKQANSVVEGIVQTGILGLAEFKNRREQLQKLYRDLCRAIAKIVSRLMLGPYGSESRQFRKAKSGA